MSTTVDTRIKICGITHVSDAREALASGADYIGLIFVSTSKRAVSMPDAQEIVEALKGQIKIVGVFQNEDTAIVNNIVEELSLDFAQLHGQETIAYCASIKTPVIKVLELKALDNDYATFEKLCNDYSKVAEFLLFDKAKTDTNSNWLSDSITFLRNRAALMKPFFFAGGLNENNVQSVIEALLPYAVDVASGVEEKPGKKDLAKLKRFTAAVKGEVVV